MNRRAWLLLGAGAGFALFALAALDEVLHGPLYRLDFRVDAAMTALAAAGWPIHPIGDVMSLPGSLLVDVPALLAATAVLWAWGRRALAGWCLAGGLGVGALNGALKAAFRRPLPPFIAQRFHGYAFPSGHTMGATGTLGIAILLLAEGHATRHPDRRARTFRTALWAWAAVALVTGVGRVLAQNHWASDVLAGWAIGVGLACATLLLALPRQGL